MQLIRTVIKIGNSEGIVIPKLWLESVRQKTGQQVVQVLLDINGSITITPLVESSNHKESTKEEQ